MKTLYLKIKGTEEQALRHAEKHGVEASVSGYTYDEETDAHETTLRIKRGSVKAARRWAAYADDNFPVGTVVKGY